MSWTLVPLAHNDGNTFVLQRVLWFLEHSLYSCHALGLHPWLTSVGYLVILMFGTVPASSLSSFFLFLFLLLLILPLIFFSHCGKHNFIIFHPLKFSYLHNVSWSNPLFTHLLQVPQDPLNHYERDYFHDFSVCLFLVHRKAVCTNFVSLHSVESIY